MGMKVCKLVRLTKKNTDGEFEKGTKGEGQIVIRPRCIIEEASVKETEDNYKQTGLLYIVDEKATSERDAEVEKERVAAGLGSGTAETEESEFDAEGYNKDGFNAEGYNKDGFDAEGYNKDGFDAKGKKKPAL